MASNLSPDSGKEIRMTHFKSVQLASASMALRPCRAFQFGAPFTTASDHKEAPSPVVRAVLRVTSSGLATANAIAMTPPTPMFITKLIATKPCHSCHNSLVLGSCPCVQVRLFVSMRPGNTRKSADFEPFYNVTKFMVASCRYISRLNELSSKTEAFEPISKFIVTAVAMALKNRSRHTPASIEIRPN